MTQARQLKTTLEKFDTKRIKVYALHLPVPNEIAKTFIDGENRRIKCTFGNGLQHITGLMPFQKYWYILMNHGLVKKLGLTVGQDVTLLLEKDDSAYGIPMPEELQVLLDQDESGHRHFHNLTPGKQRNLIYIVSKVKNPDSRLSKALAIVDHLNSRNGQLDFKLLAQKIKDYNQRENLN